MQLLYPIGFLALIGLLIPVIIHLWSVKQGKTLKIGSIALLGESASATSKSLKLTDVLLFILRCLLIILIAFILAQPYLKTKVDQKASGWILVSPNQLHQVYKTDRKSIDSLLNLGYELHEFDLGFKKMELADTAIADKGSSGLSYTSLLKSLQYKIPSSYTTYVYADDKLNNFSGAMPKTAYKLIWKSNSATDSTKFWSANYFGKTFEAKSTQSGTTYTEVTNSNLPSLSVVIYEPNGNDAQYVKAALRAIADFSKRNISIQNFNRTNAKNADVVFWLSEQSISPYLAALKPNTKIFAYQNGKVENVGGGTFHLTDGLTEEAPVKLYKRIKVTQQKGKVIWKDSYGQPLLLRDSINKNIYFNFYSRLNPQFTDLVWKEQFVNAIMPIVLAGGNEADFGFETNPLDQRAISAAQQITSPALETTAITPFEKQQPLYHLFWILAFLVLLLERILSFRKTNLNHGKR